MEKLRRYADDRGDKRKFLGAVAGAVVADNVREYALKKGFYVIRQSGDTVTIENPAGFKPKTWQPQDNAGAETDHTSNSQFTAKGLNVCANSPHYSP
jgi:hypothetical protein